MSRIICSCLITQIEEISGARNVVIYRSGDRVSVMDRGLHNLGDKVIYLPAGTYDKSGMGYLKSCCRLDSDPVNHRLPVRTIFGVRSEGVFLKPTELFISDAIPLDQDLPRYLGLNNPREFQEYASAATIPYTGPHFEFGVKRSFLSQLPSNCFLFKKPAGHPVIIAYKYGHPPVLTTPRLKSRDLAINLSAESTRRSVYAYFVDNPPRDSIDTSRDMVFFGYLSEEFVISAIFRAVSGIWFETKLSDSFHGYASRIAAGRAINDVSRILSPSEAIEAGTLIAVSQSDNQTTPYIHEVLTET